MPSNNLAKLTLAMTYEGILLLNKPKNKTSFSLVSALRKATKIKKIGHSGTLDPFASGVMVMLIGRGYTRLSSQFLNQDKEYVATLCLGIETDTYDCEGKVVSTSPLIPALTAIEDALQKFQGTIDQIPPMFSAKKVSGKKLYELARKGIEVERKASSVTLQTTLLSYCYPFLELKIKCSKGTYIRTLAYDLGRMLGSGAHLTELTRTQSGPFALKDCLDFSLVNTPSLFSHIRPISDHAYCPSA